VFDFDQIKMWILIRSPRRNSDLGICYSLVILT
jgi:hypothetical protein